MAPDRRIAALAAAIAATAAWLLPHDAAAGDARTTRIETRPFYGATVTLEHGVRVFRALPPHGNVIINPGGVTPLHLGIEQHRSYNYNYHYGPDAAAAGNGGYGAPAYAAPAHGSYGTYGGYGARRGYAAKPLHGHRAHFGASQVHGRHGHGGQRGHGGHHGGGHGGGKR